MKKSAFRKLQRMNLSPEEIDFRRSCKETLSFLNQNELENTKPISRVFLSKQIIPDSL